MFGWFIRRKPSNGCIKHDGRGRPVPKGTRIDIRLGCGVEHYQICAGYNAFVGHGDIIINGSVGFGSAWRWIGRPKGNQIKAYRLCDSPEARAVRAALFSRWRKRPEDAPEDLTPALDRSHRKKADA